MIKTKMRYATYALLLFTGLLLRVQVLRTPFLFQYDPHAEYVHHIRAYLSAVGQDHNPGSPWIETIKKYSLYTLLSTTAPAPLLWHPPAHHVACALLSAVAPHRSVVLWKAYSLFCNLATIFLVFLLLRHFFGKETDTIFFGLSIILFLPAHIYFSNFINNDVLFVFICTAFLYLSVRWEYDFTRADRIIALNLLSAAALLTKYTALVCFSYLNILLLVSSLKHPASRGLFLRNMGLTWGLTLALAGWFYAINYHLHGNPFIMPGISPERAHSFLSFNVREIFSAPVNKWHESSSVLGGFFVSFLSFDFIHRAVQEHFLRNMVFALALLLSLVVGVGFIASVMKERFLSVNIFLGISLGAIVRLLWKYDVKDGILKSSYILFLAPLLCLYGAHGLQTIRLASKTLYAVTVGAFLLMVILVSIYCLRFDFNTWHIVFAAF